MISGSSKKKAEGENRPGGSTSRTPLRHNWGKKKLTGSSISHSVPFSIFEISVFRGNFLNNPKLKIGIGSLALLVPMFSKDREAADGEEVRRGTN